jgi:hypothetical protein
MKDIITDLSISDSREAAAEKWREYVAAEKMYRKPEYTDMKKVYNQIKSGRKVIDIFKVIQRGGIRANHHPVLAIAQAKTKVVYCRYDHKGRIYYVNRKAYWSNSTANPIKGDVDLPGCLPTYDRKSVTGETYGILNLSAPVPPIPPMHMPKLLTDDYYILWEVDEWTMAPPTDPWLLRRITKTLFVVVAGWDLTEIEKSVMHGRLI